MRWEGGVDLAGVEVEQGEPAAVGRDHRRRRPRDQRAVEPLGVGNVRVAEEPARGGERAHQRRRCPRVVGPTTRRFDGEQGGDVTVGRPQGQRAVDERFQLGVLLRGAGHVPLVAGLAAAAHGEQPGHE